MTVIFGDLMMGFPELVSPPRRPSATVTVRVPATASVQSSLAWPTVTTRLPATGTRHKRRTATDG